MRKQRQVVKQRVAVLRPLHTVWDLILRNLSSRMRNTGVKSFDWGKKRPWTLHLDLTIPMLTVPIVETHLFG